MDPSADEISKPDVHGTTERVAKTVLTICEGAEMTTAEVAEMVGFRSWEGAERMLERASRVVPITKEGGVWKRAS